MLTEDTWIFGVRAPVILFAGLAEEIGPTVHGVND